MAFLDFSGVFEPEVVPEGEYQLRVLEAEVKTSKNTGGEFIMVKLDIPSNPKSKDINHVMMLPTAQDDVKKRNNRLSNIQQFLKACGYNNVDNINEVLGATPWAIIGQEDGGEFGQQNRVKKFVTGK